MPRTRIISYESAGVLVSVRLSASVIELLDLISERDSIAGRSALIRQCIDEGIARRVKYE